MLLPRLLQNVSNGFQPLAANVLGVSFESVLPKDLVKAGFQI